MEKSKLFLSWSGERSKKMATILGDWLEDVLQTVDPFMSDTDIAAGDIWFDQIGANLEASRFAIICVTAENADSKWLHFEAGAIGMTQNDGARGVVVPLLLGLSSTDLTPPLSLFQAVPADKQGTFRMVQAINGVLAVRLDAARLERAFDRWWPGLERALASIPEPTEATSVSVGRSDREILEELLTLLRRESSTLPTSGEARRIDEQPHPHYRLIRKRVRAALSPFGIGPGDWKAHSEHGRVDVRFRLPSGVSAEQVQEALDQVSDLVLQFKFTPTE